MDSIIFNPTPKQIEAHKSLEQNSILLYGGAIRGAKSYWGCMEIISLCFKYPKSRWLVLRESLPTLKRTLMVTFQSNFIDTGFHQYVKEFNQQSLTLTWNNGSQIIFMAESFDTDKDHFRFRGLEINGAFLDEANELQESTFNKIIERSGSWFGAGEVPIKILMTANPCNNWLKNRIYDKWKKNDLPKGYCYIPAKITDNPHVPKSYIENLKLLPRHEYEVFVEGNWDLQERTGAEFYKYFSLDKHVKECHYEPSLPLHISWDENVNPYLPCGIFQIANKQVRLINTILGVNPKNTIKDVCNEFKRLYPAHDSGLFIYGDATSQKEDVKQQKGHNFFKLIQNELMNYKPIMRVGKSNPSVVMRGNFFNTILFSNFGDIEFIINPELKDAIQDFTNTKEAADGSKDKAKVKDAKSGISYQMYGHISDLTDYLICEAFKTEYQMYQRGDVTQYVRKIGSQIQQGKNRL
jgi:hypothetical protein